MKLLIPYNVMYGIGAAGTALFVHWRRRYWHVIRKLREQAAQLMRPPTPKQGQRVVLRRLHFVEAAEFSWKASVRNLVRYKKRFL